MKIYIYIYLLKSLKFFSRLPLKVRNKKYKNYLTCKIYWIIFIIYWKKNENLYLWRCRRLWVFDKRTSSRRRSTVHGGRGDGGAASDVARSHYGLILQQQEAVIIPQFLRNIRLNSTTFITFYSFHKQFLFLFYVSHYTLIIIFIWI